MMKPLSGRSGIPFPRHVIIAIVNHNNTSWPIKQQNEQQSVSNGASKEAENGGNKP
jgi:hypothetical protein